MKQAFLIIRTCLPGVLVMVLVLAACSKAPPQVTANQETLVGEWAENQQEVAVFRGIPFAAPPVDGLRWRVPQPHVPRTGNIEAGSFAPACPQGQYMVDWYAKVAAAYGHGPEVVLGPMGESEDCLYLNVWTPNLVPETPLPVMVYVHGGSNKGGWSYEPNYLGEELAARGVVVVSISYRLGPLGFFAHPALDNGPDEASSNFGLLDIAAALTWVRENIADFGGDAGNVTAFGESAGAGNLLDLALGTDQGPELFDRIIAQSTGGSLSQRRSLKQERVLGHKMLASLGIGADASPDDLRSIDLDDLLRLGAEALPGHYFEAAIDGRFMMRQPLDGLNGAQASQLELLIGTNRDEWLMYVDENSGAGEVEQWIADTAPEFSGTLHDIVKDDPDQRRALDRLITARQMLCPSRYTAERASAAGGQGFVYWFTRQRPGPGGEALGVYHGAELPYVFDQHDDWLSTDDIDRQLTESVMSYWISFAQDGSVRTDGLPEWPLYTASRPWVMELGDNTGVVEPPDAWLCRYFSPKPAS